MDVEKVKELLEILDKLKEQNPYPSDIFIEPTKVQYQRFHQILKDEGSCLDAFSGSMGRHLWNVIIDDIKKLIEETALNEPVCKTCGDKGQALKDFRLNVLRMGLRPFAVWLGVNPSYICNVEHGRKFDDTPSVWDEMVQSQKSDCQEPPVGELVEVIEIIKWARQTHQNWLSYFLKNPGALLLEEHKNLGGIEHHRKYIEEYNQVVAFLDAQQQRIEELEKQNEEIARDNLKLMSSNQQFQGQLAKRDEAIKWLYKNASVPYAEWLTGDNILRRILGDAEFERIIKDG